MALTESSCATTLQPIPQPSGTATPTESLGATSTVTATTSSPPSSPLHAQHDHVRTFLGGPPKHSRTFPAYGGGQGKPITRNNWFRFLTGWVVHFPALASTIAIIIISQQDRFWYSEEGVSLHIGSINITLDAEAINNLLQLPAKIHELLIIASLSSIALAMFRRSLILDGVRLGFLTGGYRVGDLGYLGSSAFWRQGVNIQKPWEFLLAGFVVFATILSTIVGPASAVLLVPILGWYPPPQATDFQTASPPLFYALDEKFVSPSIMQEGEKPFYNIESCKEFAGFYAYWCPASGFSDIWSWAQSFGASDLGDSLRFQYPPTELRRELVFTNSSNVVARQSLVNTGSPITLSTTPPHFLMVSLGLFSDYLVQEKSLISTTSEEYRASYRIKTPEKHKLFQPLVQSSCQATHKPKAADLGPKELQYPIESFNCFGEKTCQSIQRKRPYATKEHMTWLGKSKLDGRSATSSFLTHGNKSSILLLVGQLPDDGEVLLYACGFMASWMPSNFTFDPKASDILNSSFSNDVSLNSTLNLTDWSKGRLHEVRPITFNRTVLDYIVPSFDVESDEDGAGHHYSALDRILQLFVEPCTSAKKNGMACVSPVDTNNVSATSIFLAKVLGIYLTETLSRSPSGYFTYLRIKNTGKNSTLLNLSKQYGRDTNRSEYPFVNETHFHNTHYDRIVNLSHATSAIHLTTQIYGYGSGHSGATLHFALSMMYIYLGVIGIYAASIGIRHLMAFVTKDRARPRGRVLSVIPWSDLQDLIVVALKSSPPSAEQLVGAGAGLSNSKDWNLIVKAKADKDQNVNLVVGESDAKKMDNLDCEGRFTYL
ncbi:unnamed protein product [Colletotrichum noveboracense]|uniref:Uncharacterized protein n=1 Tax=Colletotrichum noveboracense TaxID=2664923 RepID=A0A9W4RYC2_9PEZI|nr:unnamed protein product [Colletotrichum noveboracense]